MLDFIEFLFKNRNEPLGYIVLAAIVFVVDRLARKFITSQVKRLFRVNQSHELAAYEARQIHIEKMVEELLRREGLPYDTKPIAESPRRSIAKNFETLLKSLWEPIKRRIKRMGNINKGILLPLLSAIALFVKQVWGYELSDEQINMYADIALYLIMFIGLFMKPRKEKKKDEQLDFTDGPAA